MQNELDILQRARRIVMDIRAKKNRPPPNLVLDPLDENMREEKLQEDEKRMEDEQRMQEEFAQNLRNANRAIDNTPKQTDNEGVRPVNENDRDLEEILASLK